MDGEKEGEQTSEEMGKFANFTNVTEAFNISLKVFRHANSFSLCSLYLRKLI